MTCHNLPSNSIVVHSYPRPQTLSLVGFLLFNLVRRSKIYFYSQKTSYANDTVNDVTTESKDIVPSAPMSPTSGVLDVHELLIQLVEGVVVLGDADLHVFVQGVESPVLLADPLEDILPRRHGLGRAVRPASWLCGGLGGGLALLRDLDTVKVDGAAGGRCLHGPELLFGGGGAVAAAAASSLSSISIVPMGSALVVEKMRRGVGLARCGDIFSCFTGAGGARNPRPGDMGISSHTSKKTKELTTAVGAPSFMLPTEIAGLSHRPFTRAHLTFRAVLANLNGMVSEVINIWMNA